MVSARLTSSRFRRGGLALIAALTAANLSADEITGKDRLICTAWRAISCSTADDCESTEAWRLNLPDFVKVDLTSRSIGTFAGANEERNSEIETVARRDGKVFLNGTQEDRGFTWVINDETGEGTLAIATDTTVISLFTVCAATDDIR